MPKFFNSEMAELTHQLTLSPRRLRMEQLRGIDRLLGVVEAGRAYPFDFVCHGITKYQKRGESTRGSIPGKALLCDLVLMAEVISRKVNLTVGELEQTFETHLELAQRLQVSTKTIRRWRNRGLMGVRVVFEDGVNRLAFCKSSVDRFVERNRALVEKGAAFRQLTETERNLIVERARQLVAERPMKLHAAAKTIAAELHRAVETVRYTLRRYDATPGTAPLFKKRADGGHCDRWNAMWRCFEAGESAAAIAKAYECGEAEVAGILRRIQADKWMEPPLECIYNELFDAPNADSLILEPSEPPAGDTATAKVPRDLPAYLRHLYEVPLLTFAQEQDLFRRYNYLKFKTAAALKTSAKRDVGEDELQTIRRWMAQIEDFRRRIIRANLRLVVSVAKKHVGWSDSFYEVVSDGNMSLMRAVEKFDYARGYKFSTYATWAIMKNYARSIPEDRYRGKRFVTGQEGVLDAVADHRPAESASEGDRERVRELISTGMKELSERERDVITSHFGLNKEGTGLTLEQIGRKFGVTKERIRQIEQQAMARLRSILAPSLADSLTS